MTDIATVTIEPVGWRCFHCDEVFVDEHCARLHFGRDEGQTPACQIKGSEHGLVEALRRAENDAADAWRAIHNETTDSAKAYFAQSTRHQEQLRVIEQIGYDRCIADVKAHPEELGLASSEALAQARSEGKAEGMRDGQQMEKAAQDVLVERERQKTAEGWTPEHDDAYHHDELSNAAACYASPEAVYWGPSRDRSALRWPWQVQWWKPNDRRRNLVKAGALILAEIERIDRLAALTSPPADGETKP